MMRSSLPPGSLSKFIVLGVQLAQCSEWNSWILTCEQFVATSRPADITHMRDASHSLPEVSGADWTYRSKDEQSDRVSLSMFCPLVRLQSSG
eukprot:6076081-Karenia_brevis.AAC.1